ncbi:MAG: heavy-metal-associated domain-containing protein [Chloroflexi bacterium]|nr:MAG: heavy-metal-associated domain-containing protein [Chloroflexota bacterium]
MMQSTTLVSPDISCQHCQRAIEGAVGKIGGVKKVTVNIAAKAVYVEYDPRLVTPARIEQVMDDVGYTVTK